MEATFFDASVATSDSVTVWIPANQVTAYVYNLSRMDIGFDLSR
ncbi:periplasmic component [Pseudomonas syringae pv. actinidiae]|uniref:Periplasmic component n=1 Tax=Pseudomonas syringae pv. actinidiae TaxID=103796 RepID=A0AAN4QB74_PSESF|nr:periplasmic component [Pseudomonas syringae pv. actinidiae]